MQPTEDELHALLVARETRRTALVSLSLVVLVMIALVIYLIVVTPSKNEGEGKPTERERELNEESLVMKEENTDAQTFSFSPSPEAVSMITDTYQKFHVATKLKQYEEYTEELVSLLGQKQKELDELYSFIDTINNFLGGMNVITN